MENRDSQNLAIRFCTHAPCLFVCLHVYVFVLCVCVCVDLKFINLQNGSSLQAFDYICRASIAKRGASVDISFCTLLINFTLGPNDDLDMSKKGN